MDKTDQAMKELRLLLAVESPWIPCHCREVLERTLVIVDAAIDELTELRKQGAGSCR